jgi:hypothetical protein
MVFFLTACVPASHIFAFINCPSVEDLGTRNSLTIMAVFDWQGASLYISNHEVGGPCLRLGWQ